MRIKPVCVSLPLIAVVASAFAEPEGFGRTPREAVRAYHVQSAALDRNGQRIPQQGQQFPEQRRDREGGLSDSSGYGAQGSGQSNSSADNMRKQGKLSPEERRALRRQIDEAGHDLYAPRR